MTIFARTIRVVGIGLFCCLWALLLLSYVLLQLAILFIVSSKTLFRYPIIPADEVSVEASKINNAQAECRAGSRNKKNNHLRVLPTLVMYTVQITRVFLIILIQLDIKDFGFIE